MEKVSIYSLRNTISDSAAGFLAFLLNEQVGTRDTHFSFAGAGFAASKLVEQMAESDPVSFTRFAGQYIAYCGLNELVENDLDKYAIVIEEALKELAQADVEAQTNAQE